MIKYFCDGCEKELPKPYGLYTLGFALCDDCCIKFVKKYAKDGMLVLPPPNTILHLNGWKCQNCEEIYETEELFTQHACAERPHQ